MAERAEATGVGREAQLSRDEWWRGTDDETFVQKVAEMEESALHELVNDLGLALTNMQPQLSSPNGDPAWRAALRMAMAKTSARRKIVRAELGARNVKGRSQNYERKKRTVTAARAALDAGDVKGALRVLINSLDPDAPTCWGT